jgi:hypothetical protein
LVIRSGRSSGEADSGVDFGLLFDCEEITDLARKRRANLTARSSHAGPGLLKGTMSSASIGAKILTGRMLNSTARAEAAVPSEVAQTWRGSAKKAHATFSPEVFSSLNAATNVSLPPPPIECV